MKKVAITCIVVFFVILFVAATCLRNKYMQIYYDGVSLLQIGEYEAAVERFNDIPNYQEYQDISDLLTMKHICPSCGSEIIK